MRQRGRLTASDIPLIRALLASGMPVAEVARKFEVRKQNIYSIKNNKSWRHRMNIEWVRGRIRDALAYTRIAENGQLVNLAERARVETSRFNCNPPRFLSYANGRKVRVPSSPVKAKQTRVKGKSTILMLESDYALVPWRRAIGGLDEPLQAWIRYCYGDSRYHAEQLKVLPYVWQTFIEQQPGRISGKVKQRLQGLALLAVQVVAREMDGCPKRYTYAELADMVDVCPNNWNQNYQGRWRVLVQLVHEIDEMALRDVGKTNKFRKEVAKVNFSPII